MYPNTRSTRPIIRLLIGSILLLAALALSSAARAQEGTEMSGPIFQNTTWSKAGSPYVVTGSVLVMEDATLRIEPGVTVRFDSEKALQVSGTLIASGTATDPILFTANSSGPIEEPGYWSYILFDDQSTDATFDGNDTYTGGSVLQHLTVEYAGNNDNAAIRLEDSSPWIDHVTVRHNAGVGIMGQSTGARITNSTITDNESNGIFIYNREGAVTIDGNHVANNIGDAYISNYRGGGGILVASNDTNYQSEITNNIVEENTTRYIGGGIFAVGSFDQSILVDGNSVRNNTAGAAGGIYARAATVTNNRIYGNDAGGSVSTGGFTSTSGGGGIYAGDSTVSHNVVVQNKVSYSDEWDGHGGGIFIFGKSAVTHNTIAENETPWYAGGLYIYRQGYNDGLSVTHNSIVRNTAQKGRLAVWWPTGNGEFMYNTVVEHFSDGISDPVQDTVISINHYNPNSSELPTIQHNNLQENSTRYILSNGNPHSPCCEQDAGPLDARNNWWGTNDESVINNKIYDFFDSSDLMVTDYQGYLSESNPDAPPAPPTGLSVALVGETFALTWDANQEADIAGYKVFYDVDSGYPWEGTEANEGNAGIDVGNNTSFNLSGLPANRNLYFTVRAYDSMGEESWYAREVAKRLPAPIFLSAEAGSANVRLAWNATNDASVTHYRVSRAISGTNSFQALAPQHVDTTYFDEDTSLIAGADYCYQVEAMNGENDLIITSNRACTTFGKLNFYVPDTVGASGAEVIVPINIRNVDGLRIGASDIWLEFDPNLIEFTAVERTPLTVDYAWAHAVESIDNDTSRVRISYIHNTPNQDPPELHGNGSLFWITFQVTGSDGATGPLDLKEYVQGVGGSAIQNENLTDLALEVVDGLFTVKGAGSAAFILGDVDGDGVVRALDAALALRLAAGERAPTAEEVQAGDINGNGVIQAADASMILYFAGNGVWPPLPSAARTAAVPNAETTLILDDVVGQPGSTVQTTLRGMGLSAVAGGDFVIVYDTELVVGVSQVAKAGLAAAFDQLEFHDDGTGRVFISMADDAEIDGDGILLALDVQLANGADFGESRQLLLAEAQLNDLNGRDFVTSFPDNTLLRQSGLVTVSPVQVSPTGLTFTATAGEGNPTAQTLTVDLGGASESWTASADQAWLSVSPSSGTGDGSVEVSVDIANLSAGAHSGQITINAMDETITVSVSLTVEDPTATLTVSPDSFTFSAAAGGSNPQTQSLTIVPGSASADWNASVDQAWLGISPASGTGPGSASVSVDVAGLSAGTHSGQIQIAANGQTINRSVTLTLEEADATLEVTPQSLHFTATAGGGNPTVQTLSVDPGDTDTSWSTAVDQPWLMLSPTEGVGAGTLTVSVDISGLAAGSHNGQVQVAANGQTINRSVTLTVLAPGQQQKVYLPAVQR